MNERAKSWIEDLKTLSIILGLGAMCVSGVITIASWFFDVQRAGDARVQHEEMRKERKAEDERIRNDFSKAFSGETGKLHDQIKESHDELKDEVRGLQRRVDVVYEKMQTQRKVR